MSIKNSIIESSRSHSPCAGLRSHAQNKKMVGSAKYAPQGFQSVIESHADRVADSIHKEHHDKKLAQSAWDDHSNTDKSSSASLLNINPQSQDLRQTLNKADSQSSTLMKGNDSLAPNLEASISAYEALTEAAFTEPSLWSSGTPEGSLLQPTLGEAIMEASQALSQPQSSLEAQGKGHHVKQNDQPQQIEPHEGSGPPSITPDEQRLQQGMSQSMQSHLWTIVNLHTLQHTLGSRDAGETQDKDPTAKKMGQPGLLDQENDDASYASLGGNKNKPSGAIGGRGLTEGLSMNPEARGEYDPEALTKSSLTSGAEAGSHQGVALLGQGGASSMNILPMPAIMSMLTSESMATKGGAPQTMVPVPPGAVVDQIIMMVQKGADQKISRLMLELHPPSLGVVDVRLKFTKQGHLESAQFSSKNPVTLSLLQQDSGQLRQMLSQFLGPKGSPESDDILKFQAIFKPDTTLLTPAEELWSPLGTLLFHRGDPTAGIDLLL